MKDLKLWIASHGLAGIFAVTRQLESRNKDLIEENNKLKEKLDQQLEKIYFLLGLSNTSQAAGIVVESGVEPESIQLPSDVIAKAEREDYDAWQAEERARLLNAHQAKQDIF